MRILLAIHSRAAWGGAERTILELAIGLRALGHCPVIVTNVPILIDRARESGLEVRATCWPQTRTGRFRTLLRRVLLGLPLAYQLLRSPFRDRIDVIHAHSPLDQLMFSVTRRLHGKPVIWTSHGDVLRELGLRRWLRSALYRGGLPHVDALVCLSQTEAGALRKIPVLSRTRILHVPPGLTRRPVEPAPRSEGGFVVGTAGRLIEAKGGSFLVDAVELLLDQIPDVALWFIGEGEDEEALRAKAVDRLGHGRVKFWGYQRDPWPLVAALDVFVLPSMDEGYSLAVVEAMVLGRAIVASAVGDVPIHITHGVDGLLVPAGDAEALAVELRRLATDESLRRRIAGAAQAKASDIPDPRSVMEDRLLPLYREVTPARSG